EVTVENGEVTLSGTVSDRRQKRIAEDAAGAVMGVKDVANRLRIVDAASAALTAAPSPGGWGRGTH
ncbi:MAG TPA: BON domain-containing protein, partial [Polyangiaceae bacterium]|nr:BON domain-containing protein [Polyangiaceae bacterium]